MSASNATPQSFSSATSLQSCQPSLSNGNPSSKSKTELEIEASLAKFAQKQKPKPVLKAKKHTRQLSLNTSAECILQLAEEVSNTRRGANRNSSRNDKTLQHSTVGLTVNPIDISVVTATVDLDDSSIYHDQVKACISTTLPAYGSHTVTNNAPVAICNRQSTAATVGPMDDAVAVLPAYHNDQTIYTVQANDVHSIAHSSAPVLSKMVVAPQLDLADSTLPCFPGQSVLRETTVQFAVTVPDTKHVNVIEHITNQIDTGEREIMRANANSKRQRVDVEPTSSEDENPTPSQKKTLKKKDSAYTPPQTQAWADRALLGSVDVLRIPESMDTAPECSHTRLGNNRESRIIVYMSSSDKAIKILSYLRQNQASFEKSLVSKYGQPELIKPIPRHNCLMVVCKDEAQKNQLLKAKSIGNLDVVVSLPHFELKKAQTQLVHEKLQQFVIKGIADDFSDSFIQLQTGAQTVKRFLRKDDHGNLIPTTTVQLAFQHDFLPPDALRIGAGSYKLYQYIPRPMQCRKCFSFGHTEKYCRQLRSTCCFCASPNHDKDRCPKKIDVPVCKNCRGPHEASSKLCPVYKETEQALRVKVQMGKTFAQAVGVVRSQNHVPVKQMKSVTDSPRPAAAQATQQLIQTSTPAVVTKTLPVKNSAPSAVRNRGNVKASKPTVSPQTSNSRAVQGPPPVCNTLRKASTNLEPQSILVSNNYNTLLRQIAKLSAAVAYLLVITQDTSHETHAHLCSVTAALTTITQFLDAASQQ
jgi:hypothetical protein